MERCEPWRIQALTNKLCPRADNSSLALYDGKKVRLVVSRCCRNMISQRTWSFGLKRHVDFHEFMMKFVNITRRAARRCEASGSQLSSLSMALALAVLQYRLSVNLAARRWTDSSCFIPVSVYGSQIVWLWSVLGRIS